MSKNINKFKNFVKTNIFIKPIYEMTLKPREMKQNYLFKKYSLELLKQFDKAMKSIDVIYWLEFGTLLGAYREKDFISHDLDIDVGLFLDNDLKNIDDALTNAGFKKEQQIEIDDGKYGLEQTYVYKGVGIDLFYFTQKDQSIFCHVFKSEDGMTWEETILKKGGWVVQEHTFPYSGFKEIVFKGIKVDIPNDTERHLIANYGQNFMIKDTSWDYTKANGIKILHNKIGKVIRW